MKTAVVANICACLNYAGHLRALLFFTAGLALGVAPGFAQTAAAQQNSVTAIDILLDSLSQYLKERPVSPHSISLVADSDGLVVAHPDTQQALRVSRVAERLYADVQPRAGAEARRELLWAAALHEIGMMISHHDHHRHSAYLLAHADAAGFSQSQMRRVSELVLGQRGGLRKVENGLTRDDFVWQLLCLRLGVIGCHARADVDSDAIRLSRQGAAAAELAFEPGWGEAHPRTRHLLAEEIAQWERGGPLKIALRA